MANFWRPQHLALLLFAMFHVVLMDSDYTSFLHPTFYNRCSNRSNNCSSSDCGESIDEFPPFLPRAQLENGALTLAFIIAAYCFIIIATVCDSYFIPCIEEICDKLKLSKDVAAAVFMSMATSTPELCTNIIGTFITESDIGLGTIVGSSMFNTLGVAALGGLAAAKPIQLDWWPLSRDVVIYITAILMLVTVTWDGTVHWWEALILTLVYVIYFVVMFQNQRISNFFRTLCSKQENVEDDGNQPKEAKSPSLANSTSDSVSNLSSYSQAMQLTIFNMPDSKMECQKSVEHESIVESNSLNTKNESLFKWPSGKWHRRCLFYFTWPSKVLLHCSIPHPVRHPRLYPLTFIMCIVWVAITSYLVSWMITVIGYVFNIPDAILGLTFLAAGGCLPEAISVTIMSRKGEGSMGVSNALGANTMNILLSLGIPWLIKAGISTPSTVTIKSGSMEYIIMALIAAAILLFITLGINRFRLSKRTGIVLGIIYLVFVVTAVLADLLFFESRGCNLNAKMISF